MTLTTIFVPIAVVALLWHVTTAIFIYEALRKRNVKVSFLFLRFLSPKCAQRYREITLRESGKVGPLFYHWVVSINTAWIACLPIVVEKLL